MINPYFYYCMCGIAGIISLSGKAFESNEPVLLALKGMSHRGPEHSGLLNKGNSLLGHVRLSIVDLSPESNQPFQSSDGNYSIVFNGEIFNYRHLRVKLLQEGCAFRTEGDVEVLLNGLIKYGLSFLDQIEGFYAFLFMDHSSGTFLAARDRFGVKPFYYHQTTERFYFSSELRAVMKMSGLKTVNKESLSCFIQFNYIAGTNSFIAGIRKLLPGEFVRFNGKDLEFGKHYELKVSSDDSSYENAQKKVRSLVEKAVEKRLVADVPVGSFLSGGIDSTIVTGIASRYRSDLRTFSVGFKNNTHFDESDMARKTAEVFNTQHETIYLDEKECINEFDSFFSHLDEPFADSSAFNVFLLCKHVSKQMKAVLSGDGADELFGGYNKHRAMYLMQNSKNYNNLISILDPFTRFLPESRRGSFSNKVRQIHRYAQGLKQDEIARYWFLAQITGEEPKRKLLKQLVPYGDEFLQLRHEVFKPGSDYLNEVLLADFKWVLPYDMLVKVDMMSMANSLEVRSPFLDHHLAEYVMRLPSHYKLNSKKGKLILRETFKDLIPEHVQSGKKRGFELPLERWFKDGLRGVLQNDWLSEKEIRQQELFDWSEVRELMNKVFSESPGDSVARLWAIIIVTQWVKRNLV